jgi:hypothetical protein
LRGELVRAVGQELEVGGFERMTAVVEQVVVVLVDQELVDL